MAILSMFSDARKVKNSVARWSITVGGISVLFVLVLIFLYLLYVIKPIFESATIDPSLVVDNQNKQHVLSVGINEQQEIGYQIDSLGLMRFYQLTEASGRNKNEPVLEERISDVGIERIINSYGQKRIVIDKTGQVAVISAKFVSTYPNDQRVITPVVEYPLGEEFIPVSEDGELIKDLGFAMNEERAVFLAQTQNDEVLVTHLNAADDFNYDPEFEPEYQTLELPMTFDAIDQMLVTPDLALGFIRSGNQVAVYELDDASLKIVLTPTSHSNATLTSMALLSGGSSVLFGDSDGFISQWFEVAGKDGREFKEIRQFQLSETESVANIYVEAYRKSFYAVTPSGKMGLFYTTSNANLWQGQISDEVPTAFTISPRSNGLIISDSKGMAVFHVDNEHPEVTWEALWQEIWYEGYPEPSYIWQSTSASDDFEAKFSLAPISFGTMKAALYAMFFAVPIAITAAIYTAYFMTPTLRKAVKPTIEIMEALPTVILGFLAGLWLAPIAEQYLPAIVLLLLFLPTATLIAAFAWYHLPKHIKNSIPETLAPVILIPILIIAAYSAFGLSPVIEEAFFGGDMRQYITNDLGIDFDQRNALVVGIAMGFAVIPTIFSMAEDAIFSVPKHLTSGSLALGATQWQTLVKVVLLTASPGIFSAVMMGLGRAVGETMIVLMATGNTPIMDWSIFQGMRTLSANIAVEMPESEVGSSHYRILFLAAFVLFVFTFIFNTVAEFVRQRLRDKYSSL